MRILDPESFWPWIWDPGWKNFISGSPDKNPGSATLHYLFSIFLWVILLGARKQFSTWSLLGWLLDWSIDWLTDWPPGGWVQACEGDPPGRARAGAGLEPALLPPRGAQGPRLRHQRTRSQAQDLHLRPRWGTGNVETLKGRVAWEGSSLPFLRYRFFLWMLIIGTRALNSVRIYFMLSFCVTFP